jgi:Fic family protein
MASGPLKYRGSTEPSISKAMEKRLFSEKSPGQIVPIDGGEYAFIPEQLPPNWDLPVRFWSMISEAKRLIGVLDGIGRVLPNPAILLRPSEDREAIQSSALEGTYATPRELLLYELEPKSSKSPEDVTNSFREVFNYRRAIQHAATSDLPINLRLMKEMHAILLEGVRGQKNDPGNFRRIQVAIGSNRRFVPPPPQHVMACLDGLEKYIHSESPFDPLIDCFLVHYQFETIHPFMDGNGRIGRVFLALMLQRNCKMTKPWLYLSDYFHRYKDEYISGLFRISTEADWETWIEFCLRATIDQATATISRCERLLALRESFQSKLSKVRGHVRLHSIVEEMFTSPFARVIDVQSRLNITYPTAKSDLEKLTDVGILKPLPGANPKTYYAPEVFNVAYENIADDTST